MGDTEISQKMTPPIKGCNMIHYTIYIYIFRATWDIVLYIFILLKQLLRIFVIAWNFNNYFLQRSDEPFLKDVTSVILFPSQGLVLRALLKYVYNPKKLCGP